MHEIQKKIKLTVLNFLGLGNAAHKVGNEGLDILVVNASAALDQHISGQITKGFLNVSHALGDSRHDIGEAESDLILRVLSEERKELESSHLSLGLHLGGHDLQESRESYLNGSRVELRKNCGASRFSGSTHTSVLQ